MNLYHVDAFTEELFSGNPAGVCILEQDISDAQKLRIAAELKHSETAFVLLREKDISLRWFTPETEVPLCGHATLSAAHILFEKKYVPGDRTLRFSTCSGILTAKRQNSKIELDFPRKPLRTCDNDPRIDRAFGIDPRYTGTDGKLYLIEIEDPAKLRKLKPDFRTLNSIRPGEFIITSPPDDPRYDFLSRFFGPAVGIPEDPVTGSAHCYLAPYWSPKLGKTLMTGYQASPRGGVVECELSGSDRVKLRGAAVTFFETEITL